jgi:ABC-2 type transport system permease protein
MSLARALKVLGKDLRLGPRSPIFLWVLALPLLITLVIQVAFGSLFDPEPRLGIVDRGSSAITAAVGEMEGIELTLLDDAARLTEMVEAGDLDAGLVLPAGFDEQVRSGSRPPLEFYVGGESLASDRIILAVTTIDLVRRIEGSAPPVTVELTTLGQEGLPLSVRLVPLLAMYALLVAAVFLPAFSLADEREKGTINALVVSPVRLSEVVAAKGALGFVLAVPMAVFTLWLNDALGARWLPLLTVLVIGGLLLVEVGMIYGTASKDVTGVFTLIKGTAILLLAPTIFYLFPDWPQWIAKLFPTYWIINPVYEVTVNGAGLGEVWGELAIGLGVIALLVVPLGLLTRRLGRKLAMA